MILHANILTDGPLSSEGHLIKLSNPHRSLKEKTKSRHTGAKINSEGGGGFSGINYRKLVLWKF